MLAIFFKNQNQDTTKVRSYDNYILNLNYGLSKKVYGIVYDILLQITYFNFISSRFCPV